MAKAAPSPVPAPLPAEGGSYLLDPQTGKWELLDRTEPAQAPTTPDTEPPSADPFDTPTSADPLSTEPTD
ncbi:hypothetical protein EBT31_09070 [bacterium]|nr:hypothetical protein [bacterium]